MGSISLILGLAGMGLFQGNLAAVLLILLGIGLLVAEFFTPAYGILGVGGLISVVLGILFFPAEPLMPAGWFSMFKSLAVGIGVVGAVFVSIVVLGISRIRRQRPVHGEAEFVNAVGFVVSELNPGGQVKIKGEIWQALSKDGHTILFYRVVEADKSVVNVENYHEATNQLAQTTIRSVAGTADLDEILSQREKLNQTIQKIVDDATDPWGIKIVGVEIKDVVLPSEMTRAIARQAEAERGRRAAIIQAEGERQAAEQLAQASEVLTATKGGLTLRMLRSLSEVANAPNTTVLFPLPMELRKLLPGPD